MKNVIQIKFIVFLILLHCLPVYAQQTAKRTVRILLIGNSFSQNAVSYLPQMANEARINLELGRAEMGGCSLQRHWDSVLVNNADATRGLAYNGKSLRQLLRSQKWDIVTLQQYSMLSGNWSTYLPYAQNLYALIRQYQPTARVMIHQTWAYRADAVNWGETGPGKKAQNMDEMWQKSREAYHQLADQLGGLLVIPSGDAFYRVSTDKQWAFVKDTAFTTATAVYPQLPHELNSLNLGYSWTADRKLKFDPNHANEAGRYLAGLVWYWVVLGGNPATLHFKPQSVPDGFASFLKQSAATVTVQPR